MMITDNALNVLAASTYRGVGKAWIVKNIKGNESVDDIVALLNRGAKEGRVISVSEFTNKRKNIRSQLEQMAGVVDGVVALGDSNFPLHKGLVKNSEKPVALFYKGDLRLLDEQNKTVAVIGLLNPDEGVVAFEKRVVSSLVSHGATIVSGLAFGCDSIAHKQALLSGGKTIAILPSPITNILPRANKGLAEEILKKDGLFISEYYKEANSKMELTKRYLERDRLQALFSDCVVLSASYAENDLGNDSGSRHAMNYAHSYSIPRAVMYDSKMNAGNPKYELNRQIIREDDRIIIITKDNVQEAVKAILSRHAESPEGNWVQKGLFDEQT